MPMLVIAETTKGKGVSYMEDEAKWHHGVPTEQQYSQAVKEIETFIKEMNLMSTIPCRKAFTDTITELASGDPSIMVVTSDARGSVTLTDYAVKHPDQFVEVGIAEQNEVGIAAGMATFGKRPFVCAPACFLSARSLEQVKVDVVYSQTNVKIIGISGGVSYGALGYSHQSLHDIAVTRTFPGMDVIIPSDRYQTEAITRWLAESDHPAYVRMGRGAVKDIYTESAGSFTYGKANVLAEGEDVTIIAVGETVSRAVEAAALLRNDGISARVLDMATSSRSIGMRFFGLLSRPVV